MYGKRQTRNDGWKPSMIIKFALYWTELGGQISSNCHINRLKSKMQKVGIVNAIYTKKKLNALGLPCTFQGFLARKDFSQDFVI